MTKAEVQKILDTYNSKDWNDNPYFVYKQHNFKKVKWFFNSTESVVYELNNFPRNVQKPDKKHPMPSWLKK